MPQVISTYKERWNSFRAEVIELDGRVCTRCGRGPEEYAVLQVHHKKYIHGRDPWEYPYELCETLCKGCHAAEHGKIPPKVGWIYLGEEDLGDLIGVCDFCGNRIRYSFAICHEHWEPMEVGTICCDHLTGTRLASSYMESIHRFEQRKARFISSIRWKRQRNTLTIVQNNIDIKVRPSPDGFRICMNGYRGKKLFQTSEAAKAAAFEVIENGLAERFLCEHSRR